MREKKKQEKSSFCQNASFVLQITVVACVLAVATAQYGAGYYNPYSRLASSSSDSSRGSPVDFGGVQEIPGYTFNIGGSDISFGNPGARSNPPNVMRLRTAAPRSSSMYRLVPAGRAAAAPGGVPMYRAGGVTGARMVYMN